MKLTALLVSLSLAVSAQAQTASSARVGVSAHSVRATAPLLPGRTPISQQDTTRPTADRVARGALIGAAIGAGAGVVAAFVVTHKATVTDHSEDALAYLALPAFGALIGLVAGGIVGYFRH